MSATAEDLAMRHALRRRALAAAIVIALHLGVASWHNAAHDRVPVPMEAWERVIVVVFVILGPFVALALMWRRRWRAGAILLGATMTVALAYDLTQHYLLEGAGNVAHVPDAEWARAYRTTALLLVLTESIALWFASWALRQGAPVAQRVPRRFRRRMRLR